jgi:histidinol-phosphate aminotransferase
MKNLRFESAINPYGCSPRAAEAMQKAAAARDYRFYGEPAAGSLREKLAGHFALSPTNFVVFNGSGDALAAIYLLQLVMKKGTLIAPYPSYERFVDGGRRFAADLVEVPLEKETWQLPLPQLIEETRNKKATLGMISSPNNPTGNILLDETGLATLLEETPDCLWIIDEAYAEYPGVTFARMVNSFSNLVILKTFSKAYGMAGLRVGYVVTNSALAGHLAKIRLPWNVNSMSLIAAQAALEDQEYLQTVRENIIADREKFYEELSAFSSFKVYPSDANFFLIKVSDEKIKGLPEYLSARGIHVRTRPDMPEYIRVTSLLPDDNEILLGAFKEFGL